jgi:hypothetical protein
VVHCLELVSLLVAQGLSFQFKGGNSLLILLDTPLRFSIDADIATDEPLETLEAILTRITDKERFIRWERRRHKTKPWIPLSSYYIYYHSHFITGEDAYIMLDVQLTRSPYRTRHMPVRCASLYKSDVMVEVPTPASLAGDKLLTLGPATYGIPVGKGKEAQRIKHAFDVSTLLGFSPSLKEIRRSFNACMQHEATLQQRTYPHREVLEDTIAFCHAPSAHASKPTPDGSLPEYEKEAATGFDPFSSHLIQKAYSWEDFQYDTARAALCIAAVMNDSVTDEAFKAACMSPYSCNAAASGIFPSHHPQKDSTARVWDITASWMQDNPGC